VESGGLYSLEELWTYAVPAGLSVLSAAVADINHSGVMDIVLATDAGVLAVSPKELSAAPGVPGTPEITAVNLLSTVVGNCISVSWTMPEGSAEATEPVYYAVWKSTASIPVTETRDPDFPSLPSSSLYDYEFLYDFEFVYGTTYYYRVKAYNSSGYSDFSNQRSFTPTQGSASDETTGCFIATAAFGTPMAREVSVLRTFRDRYLVKTTGGRAFVRWYYRHSPAVAGYIQRNDRARAAVRAGLRPFIWLVTIFMR